MKPDILLEQFLVLHAQMLGEHGHEGLHRRSSTIRRTPSG